MKKAVFIIFVFGFLTFALKMNAQRISSDVIGSAGAFATSSNGSMSWTIGEVITETYSSNNIFFSQGFQQPNAKNGVFIEQYSFSDITVFPNPTTKNLFINFKNTNENYTIELYDLLSRRLINEKISSDIQNLHTVDLTEFSHGTYLLKIINTYTNYSQTYRIQKTQ